MKKKRKTHLSPHPNVLIQFCFLNTRRNQKHHSYHVCPIGSGISAIYPLQLHIYIMQLTNNKRIFTSEQPASVMYKLKPTTQNKNETNKKKI